MVYRNGTYVAFDGQATTDPTKSDMKYYGLLQKWNSCRHNELSFSDSHKKTYQVRDSSSMSTLKSRLLERLSHSKNMLLILSDETNWDRGLINFEIEKAIDQYKMPLIVAYTNSEYILDPSKYKSRWPKKLSESIYNKSVKCIHVPFREKAIMSAISQFSIHNTGNEILEGPLQIYTLITQKNWGYIK